MEHDMAPPNKRRRLSGLTSQSLPSHSEFMPEGPSATLLHSVEPLEHRPTSTAARTWPQHIQEVHLRLQERSILNGREAHRPLYPRQASAIISLVTTIDSLGQTTVSEVTIGATTTPSDTSSAGSTTPDSSGSVHNSSTSTHIIDTGRTTTGTTITGLGNSHNSTTTHTSTKDSTGSSHATLSPVVYHATLTDGHVATVTRSKKPYKTTFADGQVSTICNRSGDCKLGAEDTQTAQSPDETSAGSTGIATAAATSTAYVAGSPAGSPSPSSSTGIVAQHTNNDGNSSVPPPGTIAGGVVGGAAGLAVLLLLAMILLRWYKRRRQFGHHALPPSSGFASEPDTTSSGGPGMAERAGIRPLATAVPGFFRHQNRSDIEPPPSERSFQKVSGRKLPSAFSEGMSSADMASSAPSVGQERNFSSLSFYRDSQGFYGGEGDTAYRPVSSDDVPPLHSDNTGVLLSPGPQRRPTVHTGGPYNMTPSSSVPSTPNMQSPNLATIPGSPTDNPLRVINRSSTPSTVPDNRSSRFTEEV